MSTTPSVTVEKPHGPLKLSYAELADLVAFIRAQLSTQQPTGKNVFLHESLDVASPGGRKITLPTGFDIDAVRKLAEVADSIFYRYSRDDDEAVLSKVTLRWNDLQRVTTVEGADPHRVEALEAGITSRARRYRVWGGGASFRGPLGGVVLLLAVATVFASTQATTPGVSWRLAVVGAALQAVLWFVPWQRVFPGLAVLPGETSFIRRYAAEIGFVSLIIGTVLGLAGILLSLPVSTPGAATAQQTAPQQPTAAPVSR